MEGLKFNLVFVYDLPERWAGLRYVGGVHWFHDGKQWKRLAMW